MCGVLTTRGKSCAAIQGSQPKEIAPSSSFTCLEPLHGHLYGDNNNDNKKNKIKVKKTKHVFIKIEMPLPCLHTWRYCTKMKVTIWSFQAKTLSMGTTLHYNMETLFWLVKQHF